MYICSFDHEIKVAGMLDADTTSYNDCIKALTTKYKDDFGGVFVYNGNVSNVISWSETMAQDMGLTQT